MRLDSIVCVILTAGAALHAQSGDFARPTAGFVFSPGARSVRPLLGIPGAAYLGGAVLSDVNAAWVAPGGQWAFVSTEARTGFLRGLSATTPAEVSAGELIPAVDRVAWSGNAAFAALYSSSAGRLQRVRLGDAASADDPVDLTPFGAPGAIAIDPTGRRIAFGIRGAGVYAIDGAGAPALLVSMQRPSAIAFSDAGRLYAVDAGTRQIVEFGADLSPSQFAVVDSAGDTPFEPVGLAVSGGGDYVMVADRGARAVLVFAAATRSLSDTIPLDSAPVHAERLSTGSTFLLNRPRGTDWLLLLDATDKPRVCFVPAGEEEAQ